MTLALISALSVTTAGCKAKPATPVAEMSAEQISEKNAGNWTMDEVTVSDNGVDVRMYDGTANYNINGTATSMGKMEILADDLPQDMRNFEMQSKSTWSATPTGLIEKVKEMNLKPQSDSREAAQMVNIMGGQMAMAPATTAEIVSITKDTMVVNAGGITLTYRR